ncbi:MAG TPA: adenosylmethionine--8-amino-7-oxononanoate transaminase [Myxococcota bacterium]|nr:adenosylmethionine--8-amino-7-oxononanoate transaminase [Myxococcota bacterium]
MREGRERESRHLWLPYAQMKTTPPPQVAERSAGVRIALADGRELIDGVSNWWTACHGHSHPALRAAVEAQLATLPHVMLGGLAAAPTLELASRLAALLPGTLDHVFFSESGSVAVEIGMKIALQYWRQRGEPARSRFVCFRHGYHGDTFAAMSICDPEEGMHALFRGAFPEQLLAELPRSDAQARALDALCAAHAGEIAAVVVEPLAQCAGGMKFHTPDVLRRVAASSRRCGALLFLDEIATGFGRTGALFACEQAGVTPDLIALGKALTGGVLPLAATVASAEVFDAFWSDDPQLALMHGPTYSGHALACAAANASLDLFEKEPRLAQVAGIAAQLRDGLEPCRTLPGVADVRVLGALGAVQLARAPDLAKLRARFVELGVWVRPFGDVVYLAPPFVIGERDLARLIDAVVQVVREWSQAQG